MLHASGDYELRYAESEQMAADIFTKAFSDPDKWTHACTLINHVDPKTFWTLPAGDGGIQTLLRSRKCKKERPKPESSENIKTSACVKPMRLGSEQIKALASISVKSAKVDEDAQTECPATDDELEYDSEIDEPTHERVMNKERRKLCTGSPDERPEPQN